MIGEYITTKTLGVGGFGTVKLAKKINTPTDLVAIKCIDKQYICRSNMVAQVQKEISIMKDLDHPNIVRVHEVLMSPQYLYIVMDYIPGGELYSQITKFGKLSEIKCRKYVHQLCQALRYCHSRKICHRDIKPQNILIDDRTDRVFLVDFGFSSVMTKSDDDCQEETGLEGNSKVLRNMSTVCGTLGYMAPEIYHRKRYRGDKTDIWSLGVVVYVLLCGIMPFRDSDVSRSTYVTPSSVGDDGILFLKSMLNVVPEERLSASKLLDLSWVSTLDTDADDHAIDDENGSKLPRPFTSLSSSSSPSSSSSSSSSPTFSSGFPSQPSPPPSTPCRPSSKSQTLKYISDQVDGQYILRLDPALPTLPTSISMSEIFQELKSTMVKEGWNVRVVTNDNVKASTMSIQGMLMIEVRFVQEDDDAMIKFRYANIERDSVEEVGRRVHKLLRCLPFDVDQRPT